MTSRRSRFGLAAAVLLSLTSATTASSSSSSPRGGEGLDGALDGALRRSGLRARRVQEGVDSIDISLALEATQKQQEATTGGTTAEVAEARAEEPAATEASAAETEAEVQLSPDLTPTTTVEDAAPPPPLCSPAYKETECPQHCNTPFLSSMCCAYHGRTASMLTIEFPHNLALYARRDWFEKCTGASLVFHPYQAQGKGAFRPLFEVGEGARSDAKGSGVYDSYMTQAMAVHTFAEEVEDLSPRIAGEGELRWTDILPLARKMGAHGDKQISVPFDLDFVSIVMRDDLRATYEEETGNKVPRTWEEFAEYTEYWHGRDLNGDGEPDFGICSLNGAGPGGPQAMLMAIASSKLQYQGSETGTWFDTENPDAVPLFENPGFREAAELTRRLWMHSLDDQPGGWVELHEDYWHNGRCASYMWLTGSVALVLTKAPIRRCASHPKPCAAEGPAEWANRTVLWEPTREDGTYWEPRRVRSMGSATVLDRSDGKMKRCTPEINPKAGEVNCPYLDSEEDERDGVWINRVPYYYSAYQHSSVSIRKDAPQAQRDLIWDFVVMANIESAPVVSQHLGATYLDPFRRSHLTPETRYLYSKAWTEQMYDDLTKEFYYAGSSPNSALPLSIPGEEDYELAMEMYLWQYLLDIGTDCTSKDDCKCRKYSTPEESCGYGWGSYHDEELWKRSRENGGSLTTDQFASALKKRWDVITATQGGGRMQINKYRQSLGQDPLPEGNDWVIPLVVGLAASIGAILLGIVSWWVYSTYKEKQRLQKAHENLMNMTLNEAHRALRSLDYPLQLVGAKEFLRGGRLIQHEKLRNTHKLTVLDSLGDVDAFIAAGKHIVFFSHQWTSFTEPDHSGTQYRVMISSLKELAKRNGWDESLQDVYMWVDFSCIPQANSSTQSLAIRSLASYASSAMYFIIVAPDTAHADLDTRCDMTSYEKRTWCRAEQVCYSMRNGTQFMYLATSEDSLELVKPDFFMESLHVFEGELTCCRLEHKGSTHCDRQSLVIPLLGLYGELFRASHEAKTKPGSSFKDPVQLQYVNAFLREIEEHQETIFPRTFQRVMWRKNKRVVEELPLFGDLIERMQARIVSGEEIVVVEELATATATTEIDQPEYLKHGSVVHGQGMMAAMDSIKADSVVGQPGFLRHGSVIHGGQQQSQNGGQGRIAIETAKIE